MRVAGAVWRLEQQLKYALLSKQSMYATTKQHQRQQPELETRHKKQQIHSCLKSIMDYIDQILSLDFLNNEVKSESAMKFKQKER